MSSEEKKRRKEEKKEMEISEELFNSKCYIFQRDIPQKMMQIFKFMFEKGIEETSKYSLEKIDDTNKYHLYDKTERKFYLFTVTILKR